MLLHNFFSCYPHNILPVSFRSFYPPTHLNLFNFPPSFITFFSQQTYFTLVNPHFFPMLPSFPYFTQQCTTSPTHHYFTSYPQNFFPMLPHNTLLDNYLPTQTIPTNMRLKLLISSYHLLPHYFLPVLPTHLNFLHLPILPQTPLHLLLTPLVPPHVALVTESTLHKGKHRPHSFSPSLPEHEFGVGANVFWVFHKPVGINIINISLNNIVRTLGSL